MRCRILFPGREIRALYVMRWRRALRCAGRAIGREIRAPTGLRYTCGVSPVTLRRESRSLRRACRALMRCPSLPEPSPGVHETEP